MDWHFATWQGQTQWIAMAKREPFETGNPLTEPGELWFEFGATPEDALRRLRTTLLH